RVVRGAPVDLRRAPHATTGRARELLETGPRWIGSHADARRSGERAEPGAGLRRELGAPRAPELRPPALGVCDHAGDSLELGVEPLEARETIAERVGAAAFRRRG